MISFYNFYMNFKIWQDFKCFDGFIKHFLSFNKIISTFSSSFLLVFCKKNIFFRFSFSLLFVVLSSCRFTKLFVRYFDFNFQNFIKSLIFSLLQLISIPSHNFSLICHLISFPLQNVQLNSFDLLFLSQWLPT